MRGFVLSAMLVALAAPGAVAAGPRVVSLDYCADQYVLALADEGQIAGLSSGADGAHSALRAQAAGLPKLRASAEAVMARQPDVIVRSYGGDARARAFYHRLGYRVHDLGFAQSFDDVASMIRAAAAALERPARGEALVARMRADLAEAAGQPGASRPAALYVTPGGVTAGAGTMIHEILTAAGFENIAARGGAAGWRALPLEALVLNPPDLIVTGFFDMPANELDNWSVSGHPAMADVLARTPSVHLDGAQLACAAWFMAEAAASARRQADAVLEQRR